MQEIMKRMTVLQYYKTEILVVFSFLLGCMLMINLTPINKTCRIEDEDREYNIMRNSKFKDPELIILILSAPTNLAKRNTVRETWLKLIPQEDTKFKMKHYFVIGSLGLKVDDVFHLSGEQSQHNDILILPMYDSYQNLTEKVLKSFEWLDEQFNYGLGFKYVLKCDDDSFIRVDKLANEMANFELIYMKANLDHVQSLVEDVSSPFLRLNMQINHKTKKNQLQLYWGYFTGNARIKSTGKWKEPAWIFCDKYVPYALGGGYILSKELISYIARNSKNFKQFNSEDVSVGLWLAPVSNILRIHDIRFDTEWTSRGCQNFYLVTHNISVEKMKEMYKNVVKTNNMCSTQVLNRNHYLYNWSSTPSQCCSLGKN